MKRRRRRCITHKNVVADNCSAADLHVQSAAVTCVARVDGDLHRHIIDERVVADAGRGMVHKHAPSAPKGARSGAALELAGGVAGGEDKAFYFRLDGAGDENTPPAVLAVD